MFKQYAQVAWKFSCYLVNRFNEDGCRQSAAALTYMSLFAVVPLLTMIYAMFSMVPAFQGLGDQVNELIFNNLVPESGAEVQSYLLDFSSQARKLSAMGVVILAVTAYLMLSSIEKTFNKIWGTAGGRKGLASFLLYWAVLSLGPLLIGLGVMMQTYLASLRLMVNKVDTLGLLEWVFEYVPFGLTCVAFSLLFLAVPNCRVSLRYAVVGGVVSTVFFESAKWSFGLLVANSSYTNIYGAFAVVPIFLIWIYLCWMIVLGGAELVRSLETFKSIWRGYQYPDFVLLVIICWECHLAQTKGQSLSDKDMFIAGVDQQRWRELRDLLLKHHFLALTSNGRYVLMKDLSKTSLWQLSHLAPSGVLALPKNPAALKSLQLYPWFESLNEMIEQASSHSRQLFSPSIDELFERPNKNQEKLHEQTF